MTTEEIRHLESEALAYGQNTLRRLSPRVLQFQRGNPWYATDEEVDKLRQEYLTEKYKRITVSVLLII